MNIGKIKKTIFFFTAIDIILISLYGGLYYTVRQKTHETGDLYSSLYRRTSDEETLIRLEKMLADTEEQRMLLDDYLITPTESLVFIEHIESLGQKTSTDMQVTSLTSPKKPGDPFLLDFTAQGKFEDVYRLLLLLKEIPFRITVKKATLTAMDQETTTPSLWKATFTIILKSYLPE